MEDRKEKVLVGICRECFQHVVMDDNFQACAHGDEDDLCPGGHMQVHEKAEGTWYMIFDEDGTSYELVHED